MASLFFPVRAGRAGEEVALQIEAAIVDGRLSPGERLPSEREMGSQFGTGRGVVREAVKLLQQKGLLEVRKGAKGGAYVRRLDVANVSESLALFLKQHPVEIEKLIEFRESLDRTITQLAVVNADQAEKDALLKGALRLEALLGEDEPDLAAVCELDRRLNIMLAQMTRNPLFEWVMRALQMGFSSYDHALYEAPKRRKKAAANWKESAAAIAEGRLMRALGFVGRHYVLLRRRLDEQTAPTNEPDAEFLQDENPLNTKENTRHEAV